MVAAPNRFAQELFDGIAQRYDRPADVLSFWRYGRWRRELVEMLDITARARVLDVATGTGLIAGAIEARTGAHVIGLDLSEGMLRTAASGGRSRLIAGSADALPFADGSFDAVSFSYLLRYVDDPARTLHELARIVRPGGMLGSVEFGVPGSRLARLGWLAYALGVLPLLTRSLGPGWRTVGDFLGPSILAWDASWPIPQQVSAWHAAGVGDVRVRKMTLGAGVVMVGRKHGDTA